MLKVEGLNAGYGSVNILWDIGFEVKDGEIVAILGSNGAGKTTVFNLLTNVYQPTRGSILIDGMPTAGKKTYQVNRMGVARTFQNIRLFKELSVIDNIKVGLHESMKYNLASSLLRMPNYWKEEKQCTERALELLDIFHMADLANAQAGSLPYGAQRRLEIMRALATGPKLLLLDEPAAGLDPEGRDDILSEVKEYHKKTGTTVLLVSHSMEDIAKYANRVLVMSNKKIAMYDTVEKVFARAPELLELGLSVPQVTKIFLKLREMGVDVPADVYTIPYAVKTLLEAKRRRDAGESLVLPRSAARKGGAV